MMRARYASLLCVLLTGCGGDFVPREKVATYNPETKQAEMPHPCPDWSHSSSLNYDNSDHSNFGCATRTNLARQLAYPEDLAVSAGHQSTDTEATVRTIERYRAGEIPAALQPIQSSGSN